MAAPANPVGLQQAGSPSTSGAVEDSSDPPAGPELSVGSENTTEAGVAPTEKRSRRPLLLVGALVVLVLAIAGISGGLSRSKSGTPIGVALIPVDNPGDGYGVAGARCDQHPDGGACFPEITLTNTTAAPIQVSPVGEVLKVGGSAYYSSADAEDPQETTLNPGESTDFRYRYDVPNSAISGDSTSVDIEYSYAGFRASLKTGLQNFTYATPCSNGDGC